MANEFNIKNGFITSGNSNVYANLNVTGTLSASTISASTISSPFTTGSVIFQGSGGTLTQSNSQLFWDNVNNRFGVGTASPISELSVGSINGITLQSGVIMPNLHRDNTDGAFLIRSYNTTTTTYTTNVKVRPNGNFLIGTTTDAGQKLQVSGNTLIQGGLTATTISATTISASTVSSPFTTGSVIFQGSGGTLSENNSQLFWDNTNARLGIGTVSPATTLQISGTTTTQAIIPVADSTYNLGTAALRYNTINLRGLSSAGNSLDINAGNINLNDSVGAIKARLIGATGNFLIGTTTDAGQKLQVSGNTLIQGGLTATTFSGNSNTISGTKGSVITDGSSTTAFLTFSGSNTIGGTGYTDFIRVTNTAAGATNPNKTFRTNNTGALEIVNSTYGTVILSLTDAGVLVTTGGGTSDSRKKQNIQYIDDETTPHILNLKPVKFEYKDYSGTTRHGFIAQDVLETYPELVLGDGEKENGTYGLDYDGILSLTVKSLQETILKVEKLEKELNELKNKMG